MFTESRKQDAGWMPTQDPVYTPESSVNSPAPPSLLQQLGASLLPLEDRPLQLPYSQQPPSAGNSMIGSQGSFAPPPGSLSSAGSVPSSQLMPQVQLVTAPPGIALAPAPQPTMILQPMPAQQPGQQQLIYVVQRPGGQLVQCSIPQQAPMLQVVPTQQFPHVNQPMMAVQPTFALPNQQIVNIPSPFFPMPQATVNPNASPFPPPEVGSTKPRPVHFLGPYVHGCPYPVLPVGKTFEVSSPVSYDTEEIASQDLIITSGSKNLTSSPSAKNGATTAAGRKMKTPQHCRDFQFNKVCYRGSDCMFIHSVRPMSIGSTKNK